MTAEMTLFPNMAVITPSITEETDKFPNQMIAQSRCLNHIQHYVPMLGFYQELLHTVMVILQPPQVSVKFIFLQNTITNAASRTFRQQLAILLQRNKAS